MSVAPNPLAQLEIKFSPSNSSNYHRPSQMDLRMYCIDRSRCQKAVMHLHSIAFIIYWLNSGSVGASSAININDKARGSMQYIFIYYLYGIRGGSCKKKILRKSQIFFPKNLFLEKKISLTRCVPPSDELYAPSLFAKLFFIFRNFCKIFFFF